MHTTSRPQKLEGLTQKQRKAAADMLDAYINKNHQEARWCLQLFFTTLHVIDEDIRAFIERELALTIIGKYDVTRKPRKKLAEKIS